jgi:hypothetical protein
MPGTHTHIEIDVSKGRILQGNRSKIPIQHLQKDASKQEIL